MSSLKRQIKATEKRIEDQDRLIQQQQSLFIQGISRTPVLIAGLIGSFISGYVYARNKTVSELLRSSLSIALTTKKVVRQIKSNRLVNLLFAQQKTDHHP